MSPKKPCGSLRGGYDINLQLCRPQVVLRSEFFTDRGQALFWTAQWLPALLDLDISYEGNAEHFGRPRPGAGLPRCAELAALRSRSLTRLRVCMLDGDEQDNFLRLSGLPELRSLELAGRPDWPLDVRIDSASFEGTPQLRSLCVRGDEALRLQECTLQRLTALTSLSLVGCGLQLVPLDVGLLADTLLQLDLSRNDPMELTDNGVVCIVHCSRLRTLNLHKPDKFVRWADKFGSNWPSVQGYVVGEGYRPLTWKSKSIEQLVQLPSEFRARHGRDLDLRL